MKYIQLLLLGTLVLASCSTQVDTPSAEVDTPNSSTEVVSESSTTTYTLEELAMHDTKEDCWTVIDGKVADVTSYFGRHPGGDENLAEACGIDATQLFEGVRDHDPKGFAMLENFVIGELAN